jgi:hypothetical protein
MPLQNRVSPIGSIVSVSSKGTLMGNRGILHNENKEIKSLSKHKCWVTCKLEFKGRKRELMAPNKYTELFFLDEATAFAAGHRPCGECRRDRYKEFKSKWLEANFDLLNGEKDSIGNIDKIVHKERIYKNEKVTYSENIDKLPNGTMIKIDEKIYVIWDNSLYLWSFDGYEKSNLNIRNELVKVLTPFSYVRMFEKGFIPFLHYTFDKLK